MTQNNDAMTRTSARQSSARRAGRPNILILCMDQWQTHMQVPNDLQFPAMRRLEAQGVSFDRHYCTMPLCTPSRATMWTGVHAKQAGLPDNTNFAWTDESYSGIPTIGHMLRDQGYYTAFKGKWHLWEAAQSEDGLERYGFSDYQQWGEMFGAPLQGQELDNAAVFETIDWLQHRATQLEQPWLLICSLINPHDVMFLQTDPVQVPHVNGMAAGLQSTVQRLGWFERDWDVKLPDNFADDHKLQPPGVRYYKNYVDQHFGRIPDDRTDLWLKHRNYLINCMRLVDAEFNRVLQALDHLDLWRNTVVIFTSDHGEMNGAHRMTQKANIPFEEVVVVNLTVCVPDGPQGRRTAAVGSHLDLVPTLLDFAGLGEEEIRQRYSRLKGHSLKSVILNPGQPGPRGTGKAPGDGALICWDGLHALDTDWAVTGALKALTNMAKDPTKEQPMRLDQLKQAGQRYGAPDFTRRTFFRAISDGRYKLVRWFSPQDYEMPSTLDELYASSDVGLYDLFEDPGEMENIGHPDHPNYAPALVEWMRGRLSALIQQEIGEDRPPFDLDLFGTREVKYRREVEAVGTHT